MGIRGAIRDILILYISTRLIFVWISGRRIPYDLAIVILLLALSAVWFLLERTGIVSRLNF